MVSFLLWDLVVRMFFLVEHRFFATLFCCVFSFLCFCSCLSVVVEFVLILVCSLCG